VAKSEVGVIHPTLAFLSDFSNAFDFIFHTRESQVGGVQVGGFHQVLEFTWEHLKLSGAAVLIACAVAIPIGLVLGHIGKGELLAISISNVGRAVPSLALIAFFVAYIGVGFTNVTLALVLLAIPPILTNTYVGVRQVDPEVIDAGRGMGLTAQQVVRRIELPLAVPSIFGGIRTSAVNVVATATIAPLAGVLTLGDFILSANVYGQDGRLAGAILVALLAVAVELAFATVQRVVSPRGMKVST
jgi:osmoprotectant transport system permease protein